MQKGGPRLITVALLVTEGETWNFHRKLLNPVFSYLNLKT
jgi:cytochrome P450